MVVAAQPTGDRLGKVRQQPEVRGPVTGVEGQQEPTRPPGNLHDPAAPGQRQTRFRGPGAGLERLKRLFSVTAGHVCHGQPLLGLRWILDPLRCDPCRTGRRLGPVQGQLRLGPEEEQCGLIRVPVARLECLGPPSRRHGGSGVGLGIVGGVQTGPVQPGQGLNPLLKGRWHLQRCA